MADVSDVCNALVTLAAQAVYPNGTGQASIANTGVRLFQGWPLPQQLDADLKAGVCQVSVYPRPEERNTARYPQDWQQRTLNTPTLASFSGSDPQLTGVLAGKAPVSSAINLGNKGAPPSVEEVISAARGMF